MLEEKEETAYLFRRNFATHLHALGLCEDEIQYIIGHRIENTPNRRNYYTNEEKLYPIKLKMDKRPLFSDDFRLEISDDGGPALIYEPVQVTHVLKSQPLETVQRYRRLAQNHAVMLLSENEYHCELHLPDSGNATVQMNVVAQEPNDTIDIRVEMAGDTLLDVDMIEMPSSAPSGPVNIVTGCVDQYKRAAGVLQVFD